MDQEHKERFEKFERTIQGIAREYAPMTTREEYEEYHQLCGDVVRQFFNGLPATDEIGGVWEGKIQNLGRFPTT
jgi:hypothetical protein